LSRVLVGVDGSPGSARALRWAAGEARLRGAELHVVHVWRLPLYAVPDPGGLVVSSLGDLDREVEATLERRAREVLDGVVAELGRETGGELGVALRSELRRGDPARELVEAAAGADLLVVGSRGLGGFEGLLLGSVSQKVLQHAPCPAAVVPAPGDAQ
jgi:nucleotide-binding universal stress UspA family protein